VADNANVFAAFFDDCGYAVVTKLNSVVFIVPTQVVGTVDRLRDCIAFMDCLSSPGTDATIASNPATADLNATGSIDRSYCKLNNPTNLTEVNDLVVPGVVERLGSPLPYAGATTLDVGRKELAVELTLGLEQKRTVMTTIPLGQSETPEIRTSRSK
jgi:hypothetical protein